MLSCVGKVHIKDPLLLTEKTGPNGTVAMSSANGLVGSGFISGSNPEQVFKGPMGRCKATTPSSLSLTSNRFTTNY